MPFDSDAPVEVTTRDRLIRLRDFLAALSPKKFDMADSGAELWGEPECGSPACIGGWARVLYHPRNDPYMTIRKVGTHYLGLSDDVVSDLFFPGINGGPDAYVSAGATPAQAAKVLDHLLTTGEVSWSAALK